MWFRLATAVFVLSFSLGLRAGPISAEMQAPIGCEPGVVAVRGDWGQAIFRIDVADTDAERGQGLMFVREMDLDKGMLFLWDSPGRRMFWMRNTYIPLDMLFVGPDGVVKVLHENAVPLDETVIDGGDGVVAVLEINGGISRQFGITVGSELQHPAFGEDAAWPC